MSRSPWQNHLIATSYPAEPPEEVEVDLAPGMPECPYCGCACTEDATCPACGVRVAAGVL